MKRKLILILTVFMLTGTLNVSAMAAEPEDATVMEQVREEKPVDPDPEGTVSWKNLRSRIQNGSLSLKSFTEDIHSIEATDYEQMQENLRKQLNSIANAQWYMTAIGGDSGSLDQTYNSLRDTFDEIKDGDLQADNADVVWRLRDASNQVTAAGEDLYLTLAGLEQSVEDMERGLQALDRSLEDARLRLELGLASQQTIKGLEQSRTETVSQLDHLNHTIATYKAQLQTMIGEAPTGELTLGGIPGESEMEWEPPDYEADLAAAKAASWTLRDAQITLDDAKEDWKDTRTGSAWKYLLEMAEHTWNSAQLTYESTVQSFEASFRELYEALSDYEQVLESKKSALAYQEEQLAITEKKYDLGQASRYDVLNAQDDAASAQSDVNNAWRDLFSARNSYQRAVEYGLL